MKESKNEKPGFFVGERTDSLPAKGVLSQQRYMKPLVFSIMGIIFAACLYLIFGTGDETSGKDGINIGINGAVPQASGDGLPVDKGKAYEQEMRREKESQQREALRTLSDYWKPDSTALQGKEGIDEMRREDVQEKQSVINPALKSYHKMQRSLGSFYQQDPKQEALRQENEKLREQLAGRTGEGRLPDRLQLMEQSYKMAAKYFPGAAASDTVVKGKQDKEAPFLEVLPEQKSVVSMLEQKVPLEQAIRRYVVTNRAFTGSGSDQQAVQPANSIRACVDKDQKITSEGPVQLRLLEAARLGKAKLPKGSIITALGKFQNNRLQLQVVSVAIDGSIFPVNLSVYDLDGQKGLNLPYAAEVTAVNGTLANMGNSAGGGITINRSAGQQLTSDAARGLIQGVSGYFSKKVRPQKATLRGGYQLFLVSKEN